MCPGAGEPRLLKPAHLAPAVRNKKRRCRDADTRHNSRAAPLTETRRARAATKTQHAQKQLVPSNAGPERSNAKLQGTVGTIQRGFLGISL
ncbi:hypothetical protein R6Z07F_006266 [Ovis aries]